MNGRGREALMLAAAGAGTLMAARTLYRRWLEYDLEGKTVLITGSPTRARRSRFARATAPSLSAHATTSLRAARASSPSRAM